MANQTAASPDAAVIAFGINSQSSIRSVRDLDRSYLADRREIPFPLHQQPYAIPLGIVRRRRKCVLHNSRQARALRLLQRFVTQTKLVIKQSLPGLR